MLVVAVGGVVDRDNAVCFLLFFETFRSGASRSEASGALRFLL